MEYRGYKIQRTSMGMREVKAVGRGSVHKSLRGLFTSDGEAIKLIDYYEDSKPKGKANGETTDNSGS